MFGMRQGAPGMFQGPPQGFGGPGMGPPNGFMGPPGPPQFMGVPVGPGPGGFEPAGQDGPPPGIMMPPPPGIMMPPFDPYDPNDGQDVMLPQGFGPVSPGEPSGTLFMPMGGSPMEGPPMGPGTPIFMVPGPQQGPRHPEGFMPPPGGPQGPYTRGGITTYRTPQLPSNFGPESVEPPDDESLDEADTYKRNRKPVQPVYVASRAEGRRLVAGRERSLNGDTGFEPPVSAEDTGKIFGKQDHGVNRPPVPGFTPRDPPLHEFLATRNRMNVQQPKVKDDVTHAENQEITLGEESCEDNDVENDINQSNVIPQQPEAKAKKREITEYVKKDIKDGEAVPRKGGGRGEKRPEERSSERRKPDGRTIDEKKNKERKRRRRRRRKNTLRHRGHNYRSAFSDNDYSDDGDDVNYKYYDHKPRRFSRDDFSIDYRMRARAYDDGGDYRVRRSSFERFEDRRRSPPRYRTAERRIESNNQRYSFDNDYYNRNERNRSHQPPRYRPNRYSFYDSDYNRNDNRYDVSPEVWRLEENYQDLIQAYRRKKQQEAAYRRRYPSPPPGRYYSPPNADYREEYFDNLDPRDYRLFDIYEQRRRDPIGWRRRIPKQYRGAWEDWNIQRY